MRKEYEAVIGLEVHVELNTKTKIFCGCSTKFGCEPNTHVCPVCSGMPGSLPVLNRKVVEYALKVGIAANCKINRYCKFDRKNYFYPDNPQNYQISQLYLPICQDGCIEIDTDMGKKKIRIHEIHMEEDAGKLIHDEFEDFSYVDFNRSGVPLIEIVSEPDMKNAEEVIAYLDQIRLIAQYTGASDCKLQEGSMRADVNLSVREKDSHRLGTRTEMKNLNSFKAIAHAIEGEMARQIDILESGRKVIQETRRWDETNGISYSMRSKEDAKDYRYFPDPDLPPVNISDDMIDIISKSIPELRPDKIIRYTKDFELPEYDAKIITASKKLADIFEDTVECGASPKKVSNWLMGETMRLLNDRGDEPDNIKFSPLNLCSLIDMVQKGIINLTVAKEVFEKMYDSDIDPIEYVEKNGLKTVNDIGEMTKTVEKVISSNPKAVEEYKNGKEKVLGFLVGQVMREMKGKANPTVANELIRKSINVK